MCNYELLFSIILLRVIECLPFIYNASDILGNEAAQIESAMKEITVTLAEFKDTDAV